MRFSDIELGTKAEKIVTIPGKKLKGGGAVMVALRVLDAADDANVISGATSFVKDKGEPKAGDPLFDLGMMVHTLLIAAVDVDSPADAREPFFSKVAEVRSLERDAIVLLYEMQQIWQNENSPTIHTLSAEELFQRTVQIAMAQDDLPFVELAPFMRSHWARITAKLLVKSPEVRSLFGLPSLDSARDDGELDS